MLACFALDCGVFVRRAAAELAKGVNAPPSAAAT
jgi:hypothetical protein